MVDFSALMSQMTGANIPSTSMHQRQADIIETLAKGYDPTQPLDPMNDPRTVFPQPEGFLGFGKDTIPHEVEELLSEEARTFLQEFYSPAEITVAKEDANIFGEMFTRVFGRSPTEDQLRRFMDTTREAEKRSGFFSDWERSLRETQGYVPTRAELEGKAPEVRGGIPPYLVPKEGFPKYIIETPKAAEVVNERDWGISPTKKAPEFAKRARDAAAWCSQLERDRPGFCKTVIGPILAADFNANFRRGADDPQITEEDLDIQAKVMGGDTAPQLSFIHPETKKRVLFDPVRFEGMADVMEWLPEGLVIGSDIIGSLGGAIVGFKTPIPGGTFTGSITGGAFGASVGRVISNIVALEKGEYEFSASQQGWIHPNQPDGQVIPLSELIINSWPDAAWSAGGGIVASTIFKISRAILSRGNAALADAMDEKEFYRAVKTFGATKLGLEMARVNAKPSASMVLESHANKLLDDALKLGGSEGVKLARKAEETFQAARDLRKLEVKTKSDAPLQTAAAAKAGSEAVVRETGVRPEIVTDAALPEQFGKQVARGVEEAKVIEAEKAGGRPGVLGLRAINEELTELQTKNAQAVDELEVLVGAPERGAATELGESLTSRTQKIFGNPDLSNTTQGIYGQLNRIRAGAKRNNKRVFDPTEADILVEKSIGGRNLGLAAKIDPKFAGKHKQLIKSAREGKRKGLLSYDELDTTIFAVRSELDNPNITPVQRGTLNQLIKVYEKIRINGLRQIDTDNFANGNPTKFAKQMQNVDKHFSRLKEIWERGITKELKEGKFDVIETKLFGNESSPEFVKTIFSDYRPTKHEQDLLRAILKNRYRKEVLTEGVPDGGAKKLPALATAQEGLITVPTSQARHQAFIARNQDWLNRLFPDDPQFAKYGDATKNFAEQQKSLAKLQTAEERLRNREWFKGALDISEDLTRVLAEEPQRVFDQILNVGSKFQRKALQEVKAVIKALPEESDRLLALERLKALGLRRIYSALDPDAAAKGINMDPGNVTTESIGFINANKPFLDELYGRAHVQNMKKLFKEMDRIVNPGARRVSEIGAPLEQAVRKEALGINLPMMAAKLYVGFLNRKARALRLGTKYVLSKAEQKLENALSDADQFAQLLKTRKPSQKMLYTVRTLGQILGLEQAEVYDALENALPEGSQFPEISLMEQAVEAAAVP